VILSKGKVVEMFQKYGYKQVHPWQDYIGKWQVLWAWRDPFHESKLSQQVVPRDVREGQIINHFPGAAFTTKVRFFVVKEKHVNTVTFAGGSGDNVPLLVHSARFRVPARKGQVAQLHSRNAGSGRVKQRPIFFRFFTHSLFAQIGTCGCERILAIVEW
jgi:hypothetical protein